MRQVKNNVLDMIGNTPLIELSRYQKHHGLKAELIAKVESFNPAGSVKDRAALSMIEAAETEGRLTPGATIVEPTSGNTGIALASIAAVKGYKVILTMPETMSIERRQVLKAYGAGIVLTEGAKGMPGAIARAEELVEEIPGSILLGQFDNPANARAHKTITGPEIWRDLDGAIDVFVAGIGTGGTITGVGEYLKEQNPEIEIIGVEPSGSPFLSVGKKGPHGLMGIGAGFCPGILNKDVIDRYVTVAEADAYQTGRDLAVMEGLLVGITSGAAVWAAASLARLPEYEGKTIVILLPDTGDRYLSTPMFQMD